ncbi:hypothetical protein [Dactylosporangium sp. NPDC049140]|jgi:hypothetical protein|uniref:hypothetical protein n=1 Tax=Dactylosporangium sp. NPDC049140 TaxID=3155647 RepID=UPI00340BC8EB
MAERVYERTAAGANAGPWPTRLEWQRAADRNPACTSSEPTGGIKFKGSGPTRPANH